MNNMPCRITDEQVYNPWEGDAPQEQTYLSLSDVSLDEIMSGELDVYLSESNEFEIINGNNETIIKEELHRASAESLADFCRRYLAFYDKS